MILCFFYFSPSFTSFLLVGILDAYWAKRRLLTFESVQNAAGDPEFAQSWPSTTHLPLIDITDIGKYLAPALLDPEKYHNARFTGATAYYTSLEMVDAWSKVTGKNIKFVQTEPGSMRGNMTEEMLETMKESTGLLTEYEYFGSGGPNDLAWTIDQLGEGVKLTSWEDFVKINEPWLENL